MRAYEDLINLMGGKITTYLIMYFVSYNDPQAPGSFSYGRKPMYQPLHECRVVRVRLRCRGAEESIPDPITHLAARHTSAVLVCINNGLDEGQDGSHLATISF